MKPEEPQCGFCSTVLEAHCKVFEHKGPRGQEDAFCDLRTRYYTDPNVGTNEVFDRLTEIATPDQIGQVGSWVEERRAKGLPPVDASSEFRDRGQAAAEKWLEGYRYGRG